MTILLATRCLHYLLLVRLQSQLNPVNLSRDAQWDAGMFLHTCIQSLSRCSTHDLGGHLVPALRGRYPRRYTTRYATTFCQAIMSPRLQRWCDVFCQMTSALAPSSNRFPLVARRRRVRLACLNAISKWLQSVIGVSSELCMHTETSKFPLYSTC